MKAQILVLILSLFLFSCECSPQVPAIGGMQKPGVVQSATFCDMSDITFDGSIYVASIAPSPFDIAFNDDGSKMYIICFTNDRVYQYSLSTAYDPTTATYDNINIYIRTYEGYPSGLEFNTDGTKMYVAGWGSDKIHTYTLTTAWDISTASYANETFTFGGEVHSIRFYQNGTKLYTSDNTGDYIREYTLTTGYDVTTASLTNSFAVATWMNYPYSADLSADGLTLRVMTYQSDNPSGLYEFSLSTAWDISTASYVTYIAQNSLTAQATQGIVIFQGTRFSSDFKTMWTAEVSDYISKWSCPN